MPIGFVGLSDLWRFRVNSTWDMIFSDQNRGVCSFGEKGVPSTTNFPCLRENAVGWFDSSREEFWVFGGAGYSRTQYLVHILPIQQIIIPH